MLIAGLTGGLACGKTFVANALRDLGCSVVEADDLGHEVMRPGGTAYSDIVRSFGPDIVGPEGVILRSRLAQIVFSNPAELARLNAIVHPAVRELSERKFREIGAQHPHAVVIYVAAILVETDSFRDFAKLIVVACPREQQIARALLRSGATEADVLARLDRQLPVEKKVQFADYVIDSGGTPEETLRQTKMVFNELKKLAS